MRILNEREPLSAGKHYEVKCESVGARPPPTITWWLAGQQVINKQNIDLENGLNLNSFQLHDMVSETTSPDGNVTVSTLSFKPSTKDAGNLLVCQAGTPRISDIQAIEDVWRLEIHCKHLTLNLVFLYKHNSGVSAVKNALLCVTSCRVDKFLQYSPFFSLWP